MIELCILHLQTGEIRASKQLFRAKAKYEMLNVIGFNCIHEQEVR